MLNKTILIFCILIIGLIVVPTQSVFSGEEKTEKQFAYVACRDRRIYVIDLVKKEVVLKSDEIKDMGWPTAIDIDPKQGRLYVASERGYMQDKYTPLVVFDINTSPIGVINYFDLVVEKRIGRIDRVTAVYEVVVSPDGNYLYIGYPHPKYSKGTTIVDSKTGDIIKHLNFYIDKGSIFSPDGKKVAAIWPSGSRVSKKDGKETLKQWSGGVATYDIENNQMLSRLEVPRNGLGLHPLWEKIDWPYVYLRKYKVIELYNRDNGKIISEIDLKKVTGLGTSIRHPLIFNKGTKAIIPMIGKDRQGYVVVIDLEKKEVISKIEVGKDPTNVVLSNFAPKSLQ